MMMSDPEMKGVLLKQCAMTWIVSVIRNHDDTILLQNDLNKIAEWEFMWQMQFNVSF